MSKNIDQNKFVANIISEKSDILIAPTLEVLKLDAIESSNLGKLSIIGDSLYFIDMRFQWVFSFNKDGKFSSKHLGQGTGKNKLPTKLIQFYAVDPEAGFFFVGTEWDCYKYSNKLERKDDYRIGWKNVQTLNSPVPKDPSPDDQSTYDLMYSIGQMRISKEYAYLPVSGGHPTFNPLSDKFAKEGRILAKMNMKNGKVRQLIGRLSPQFATDKNIRPFAFFSFDLDKNEDIFITYAPDSLIYQFDKDFNIKNTFGLRGRSMNTNYVGAPSLEKFRAVYKLQEKTRGYYTSLEYIDERNILFRCYQKDSSNIYGMQVYHNRVLVGDVDVPQGFNVVGYIPPYFYSDIFPDSTTGSLFLYKFKID